MIVRDECPECGKLTVWDIEPQGEGEPWVARPIYGGEKAQTCPHPAGVRERIYAEALRVIDLLPESSGAALALTAPPADGIPAPCPTCVGGGSVYLGGQEYAEVRCYDCFGSGLMGDGQRETATAEKLYGSLGR